MSVTNMLVGNVSLVLALEIWMTQRQIRFLTYNPILKYEIFFLIFHNNRHLLDIRNRPLLEQGKTFKRMFNIEIQTISYIFFLKEHLFILNSIK